MENIFYIDPNLDPLEQAKLALEASRQYQRDRIELGVEGRVNKYFDDVEGDWLEDWGNEDDVCS